MKKTVYGILFTIENDIEKVISDEVFEILNRYGGKAVISGYDVLKYKGCVVFDSKSERSKAVKEYRKMGLSLIVREGVEKVCENS